MMRETCFFCSLWVTSNCSIHIFQNFECDQCRNSISIYFQSTNRQDFSAFESSCVESLNTKGILNYYTLFIIHFWNCNITFLRCEIELLNKCIGVFTKIKNILMSLLSVKLVFLSYSFIHLSPHFFTTLDLFFRMHLNRSSFISFFMQQKKNEFEWRSYVL
jgi:hypothetical protein